MLGRWANMKNNNTVIFLSLLFSTFTDTFTCNYVFARSTHLNNVPTIISIFEPINTPKISADNAEIEIAFITHSDVKQQTCH